jgi:hypothetical protein
MKNRYWIKLYIGLLHDHRMGRLDAITWQYEVEMFLLAGEPGNDGGLIRWIYDLHFTSVDPI